MYEVGFLIGCIISERYYTSNVQKKAVYSAYTLTIFSSISLSLFNLLSSPGNNLEVIVVIGYTLSGCGQSLIVVLMVAYATPHVRKNPKSALLPFILGLLNISGVVGALLTNFISTIKFLPDLFMIILNIVLLLVSLIISRNLKAIPKVYIINGDKRPNIPFGYFSVAFYTYGILFGIYSSILTNELSRHSKFNFQEEMCIFSGIYSLFYSIGASIVYYSISRGKLNLSIFIVVSGVIITVFGLVLACLPENELDSKFLALWLVNVLDALIGFIDGLIEPIILHKIVTRSNRPEFFTGLFYALASITAIFVVSLPSFLNPAIFSVFLLLIVPTAVIISK